MEKRRFGRTGHKSSVAILGAFAFSEATQQETDQAMEIAIRAGVNHIDIAPTYGHAEQRLRPWMAKERDRFFLGCKTMERDREGALAEMHESLKTMKVDHFDLYQIHAITTQDELDAVLQPGGAIDALREARERGLTRYVGITGHGVDAPGLFLQALERFDFDSVLFPVSYIQFRNETYRKEAQQLIDVCRERDVGTMAIKAVAKGEWGNQEKKYNTWYEPFDEQDQIQKGINFALSYAVTGICTAGDVTLLPRVLEACQKYQPLNQQERERLIKEQDPYQPLFQ